MLEFGDIPSGSLYGGTISHASVASNGASATYGGAGAAAKWRAPQEAKLVAAFWEPHGGDSGPSSAASYRTLSLINGGQAAGGTTVLASLALSATLASNNQRALTLASNPTLAAGDVIMASQATVGGDHATHTVLVAGTFHFHYKPI